MKDLSPKLEISNLHQTERLEMAIGRLGYELISLKFEVKKLNKTILEANEKNDKLQNKLFWLTVAGTIFALISLVEAVDIILRRVLTA
jgi:hypothetical protein